MPDIDSISEWSIELLKRLGITFASVGQTKMYANIAFVSAWALQEGGHWRNSAKYNPLNTSQPMPGSRPINSHNVQAYTSWEQGLQATVKTLNNGRYTAILKALRAGNSAAATKAVNTSVWGTRGLKDPKGNIPSAATTGAGGAVADSIREGAQGISDLITGEDTLQNTETTVGQAMEGSAGVLAQLSKLLNSITSNEFWKRLGIGVGGATLIIIALILMVWSGKSKIINSTVGAAVGAIGKGAKK